MEIRNLEVRFPWIRQQPRPMLFDLVTFGPNNCWVEINQRAPRHVHEGNLKNVHPFAGEKRTHVDVAPGLSR